MINALRRTNWWGQPWLWISAADLKVERKQCLDEGRVLGELEHDFDELLQEDLDVPEVQRRAEVLLDQAPFAPVQTGHPYREPDDLAAIVTERPRTALSSVPSWGGTARALEDKVLGAWVARSAGCLLGKPVECRTSHEIETYLRAQGRWPLDRYFSKNVPKRVARESRVSLEQKGTWEEDIDGMPEDDDLNYSVLALRVFEKHGEEFTPQDVGRTWLDLLAPMRTCTAERVAMRNMLSGLSPPDSGRSRNPYREWIGARIRADVWGMVCPGRPDRAAAFAWRDAVVSYTRNGVYAAMWMAAALSSAFVMTDLTSIVRAGLAQIPARSRLHGAVERVVSLHASGAAYETALTDLRRRWDERDPHDWCHAVCNTEVMVMALLWGRGDLGKSLALAVQHGFDTDCNAANVGAIVGTLHGRHALPKAWADPLGDKLATGLAGVGTQSFRDLAQRTCALAGDPRRSSDKVLRDWLGRGLRWIRGD